MTKKTVSGIPIKPVYNPSDLPIEPLAAPGEFPFTRGIHPTMYQGKLWTMRQYAGFGSAEESNRRYRYLLSQGISGLSVAFDLPTQMGRDPDHGISKGEVGRVGVSIASADDMHRLLHEIPLDSVSISMTINATAAILLSFLLVVAEEKGVAWNKLKGTIQNDLLKEYIARGTYIYPIKPALRIITDIFTFCGKNVPEWNTISISGYHIREAGSTAGQELGFTLANGRAYVKAALDAGLAVDEFAPRLAFFFNCHNEFFEEIAKFRAARKLWAHIMKEEFGAKKPQSMMLRFHTQTAGSSLTAQQPEVNTVRTSLQALAAALGGTQSLHTNSFDEALGLPTEASATLALRTQQVIAYETGITSTVDPLAGSYFVESLTTSLEQEARIILNRIDDLGGMERAIEAGFPQQEIETAAFQYQREIEDGSRIIVGVNRFTSAEEPFVSIQGVNPEQEREQVERITTLRASRNKKAANDALEKLKVTAQSPENLLPVMVEAARCRLTVGEIADALRGVFGEYKG